MMSYEVHGLRVSSSAVRAALAAGDMTAGGRAARPAVQHQRPRRPRRASSAARSARASVGRGDGFRTLNLRFRAPEAGGDGHLRRARPRPRPTAPLDGVASLGRRPTVDDSGRVLLEVHCLDWPAALGAEGGYGKLVRVELLHKLRDEARYDSLAELAAAIRQRRCRCARLFSPPTRRRTRRPAGRRPATEFDGRWRRAPARLAGDRLAIRPPPSPPGFPLRGLDATAARKIRHGRRASPAASTDPTAPIDYRVDAEPARHAVPDARRPAQARAGLGQAVERRRRLPAAARGAPRPAALRPARRPAVRERHSCTSATPRTRS